MKKTRTIDSERRTAADPAGGFTVLELLVAVFVLGLISVAVAPAFSLLSSSRQLSYIEQQAYYNTQLSEAMQQFAHDRTDDPGRLHPPLSISNGSYTDPYAIYDPSLQTVSPNEMLYRNLLDKSDVPSPMWNTDGYGSQRIRVFQDLTGLQIQLPLYFQSGPQVTINYDFGALYMTTCTLTAPNNCPSGAYTSPPVTSGAPTTPQLAANNYTVFDTTGNDLKPVFVSSLPAEMDMLKQTAKRLDRLRDAFLNYARTQQLNAQAPTVSNYYPIPQNSASWTWTPANENATPTAVQGCYYPWLKLTTPDGNNVLNQIGMGATPTGGALTTNGILTNVSEYAQTSWSGAVEYCADFEPNEANPKGPNKPPFYGALRFNRNVNKTYSGGAPVDGSNDPVDGTGAVSGDNVNIYLSF